MLRRGRGKTGKNLFISVALISLGALLAAGLTYRTDLQETWVRLRLKWNPAHVFDLLDRDPGSPGGKAVRWFAKTAEGRELLFRTFLEEQVGGKIATSYLKFASRGSDALILWTGIDGFDNFKFTSGRPVYIKKYASPSMVHSRSIQLLLGEAGAEGLTTPDYPGLSFSFVRPDRMLQDLYHPGRGLLVMPTVTSFKVLEDPDAPPFVCLVLKSDAEYPRLLPGPP